MARRRQSSKSELAHDVRNALNGVAVNLEVARTRARAESRSSEIAAVSATVAAKSVGRRGTMPAELLQAVRRDAAAPCTRS